MKKLKILYFIAVFSFLVVPLVNVNATTIEELQAQINALLVQINSLQQQLAQLQGTTTARCYTFNVNLKYGDIGKEVEALQKALDEKENFNIFSAEKRGSYFGESTASSVVGFQEKYKDEILTPLGLKHGTGFVGTATRAKLNKLYGCGVITQPSITVLSPNGGESWMRGSTQNITWTSTGTAAIASVRIALYKGGTLLMNIADTANDGTHSWVVPTTLADSNDYKIRIMKYGDASLYDESNNYFSIIEQGLGLENIENQLASISAVVSQLSEEIKELLKNY